MCDKVRFMKRRFLAVAAISIPLMMLTEASTAFADQARPSAQFVLPNEVVSLANRYGVLVPERFQSTHNADIRGRLKQATEKHLTQSGHHLDPKATKIARPPTARWNSMGVRVKVITTWMRAPEISTGLTLPARRNTLNGWGEPLTIPPMVAPSGWPPPRSTARFFWWNTS